MSATPEPLDQLHRDAYAAFERGALAEAIPLFLQLAEAKPGNIGYRYVLGLAHKYRREWHESIQWNLQAIAVAEPGTSLEGEHWNIAIAASAIGNWALAREHWIAAGVALAPGDTPLEDDNGIVSVRLNPWSSGETLYARRIGLARARLLNIPLSDSGHRFGDIVLVDGAKTGERRYGDATVPVLNALERLVPSPLATFEVRVDCAAESDAAALEDAKAEGIGCIEDWTRSMTYFCTKCSYGVPHAHAEREPDATGWVRERVFGVAATHQAAVETLLDAWVQEARRGEFLARLARRRPRRAVLDLAKADEPEPPLVESWTWWHGPPDEEDPPP